MNQQLVEARKIYSNGYYNDKLEQGLEFQDVVTRELYQRGIVVVGYSSRRFQNQEGENMLGAEIKRDDLFRTTGNLYVEISEKSHPDKNNFTESGIFRKDNSWLYVIGDEKTIYIFSTKFLQQLYKTGKYKTVVNQTVTSNGMLLPIADAEKYCIRKIETEKCDA